MKKSDARIAPERQLLPLPVRRFGLGAVFHSPFSQITIANPSNAGMVRSLRQEFL